MYKGRYKQGQFLPLLCYCRDAAGKPTAPDVAPVAFFRNTDGDRVLSKEIPPIDRYGTPGLFGYGLFLNQLFQPGRYTIEWRYVLLGGFPELQLDTFEVTDGGSPDGSVISMYYFQRPEAAYLVQQLDSGKLAQGRNPSL